VNLTLAWNDDELRERFGGMADWIRPSALGGSSQEIIDRVGEYADAGAEMVILAMRAPFDIDGLDRFVAEVLPAFAVAS
jgi:alkanesulfonate monooxygenase SsuD/methylene tetrahydromethanopterin reductase-like flavin-dependent oxidoreductase (luciferase family)